MKTARLIAKILVIAILLVIIVDVMIVAGVAKFHPEFSHADNAIILGAAINTPALKNRTLKGLELYEQGKVDQLILSGGKVSDSDISEAQYMEKIIKQNQDDNTKYVMEDQSRNTFENINNSKQKINKDSSIVIVSDEFHLARAVLLAKRAGFEKVYWTSPEPDYYRWQELDFYYLRELVAMIAYIPKFISN